MTRDEAERVAAERERDEAFRRGLALGLAMFDDMDALVDRSSRWMHHSPEWEQDEYLGPLWEELRQDRWAAWEAAKGGGP